MGPQELSGGHVVAGDLFLGTVLLLGEGAITADDEA
jgi:hypothetical protein